MNIRENVPLKEYTSFKIGGSARFFCEPMNDDDVIHAMSFAKENSLPLFVMGLGANILVSDDGFEGLVIRQRNAHISIEENAVTAESGMSIEELINATLDKNLVGAEDFSGIPSSLGGALYINLHYFDAFIANFVREGLILNKKTLETKWVGTDWFEFGYDNTRLKRDRDYMLLKAKFEFNKVDDYMKHEAIGKSKEIIRTRCYKYPSEPSVGSIFQNLTTEEQKQFVLPTRSVAFLIDVCGLKGTRVGDALLSHRHSNMIINVGNAKAQDVIELADIIKDKVKERFGAELRFEVQLVGF